MVRGWGGCLGLAVRATPTLVSTPDINAAWQGLGLPGTRGVQWKLHTREFVQEAPTLARRTTPLSNSLVPNNAADTLSDLTV